MAIPRPLDKLIAKKRELTSSLGLIPAESVSVDELVSEVFKGASLEGLAEARPLGIVEALKLSANLFEALIAEILAKEAPDVILTPGGADQGAMAAMGCQGWDLFAQALTTDQQELDNEDALPAFEGTRCFAETKLGVRFKEGRLYTNALGYSKKMRKAAGGKGIELIDASWLKAALVKYPITLGDVILRNSHRRSF